MAFEIYPSGAWRGFYRYGASDRHRMQLDLLFSRGILTGDGLDDVGSFLITGSYDQESGACRWIKTYIGAHDVAYSGARDGIGIAGTWQLRFGRGTFRIWPGRHDETVGADESIEMPEAVEAEIVACSPLRAAVCRVPIQNPRVLHGAAHFLLVCEKLYFCRVD